MKSQHLIYLFSRNSIDSNSFRNTSTALLALAAALLLRAKPAQAANLLANPGFDEIALPHPALPSGWTRFAPPTAQAYGNYANEGNFTNQSGSLHFKEWGACYNGTNNAAGIYQDLSSAPGSTYQASGWFFTLGTDTLGPDCYVWIEVSFLGSGSNLLALYKSDAFNASVGVGDWFQYQVNHACDISSPVSIGDPFFNTYAVTGTVSQLVAPLGTTTVRYRF